MNISLESFAGRLLAGLDAHLTELERDRRAITILAPGAAFESWLAFESRLLLESSRQRGPTGPPTKHREKWT